MSSEQHKPNTVNRTKDFKGNDVFEVREVNGRKMLAMRPEAVTRLGQAASNDIKPESAEHKTKPTTKSVVERASSIVRDNNNLTTAGTIMQSDSWELYLLSPAGSLIVIEKVIPGRAKEGFSLQDVSIDVVHGTSSTPEKSISFNYNEYGDGLLRKSVSNGQENGMVETPDDAPLEQRIDDLYTSIHHLNEGIANRELEEKMGLDNLPVDQEDLDFIDDLLSTSTAIDPERGLDLLLGS